MSTSAGATPVAKVSATLALTLLVLINLFNYIDRQVLAAVEPEIRKELLPDESGKQEGKAKADVEESEDAKFWMGWLATAFLITYMLTAPLFGMLADRVSRWGLIGFGVVIWSLASGASGIDWRHHGVSVASAYWILLMTRCFVGVGEGAYGPVAPAMIADLFPVEKRGKVMAWFYLAIPVGGAMGYALGALMVKYHDWHMAFYSVVPPGIALGIWCFLMRDPPRGQTDQVAAPPRKLRWADYLFFLKIPSYTFNTMGMTMMAFAIGGLAFWMPEFLKFHDAPEVFGLHPRIVFGLITAVGGLVSTLTGGLVCDWLRPRFPGSYFQVSGIALILGFPMMLGLLYFPFPLKWVMIFLTVFLLFFNTGPTNTILANVIHPSMRGSAFALNIMIIHGFGDAISPTLIGAIAGKEHIDRGFFVMGIAMLVGGSFWLFGARFLQRDTELAPTRLPE